MDLDEVGLSFGLTVLLHGWVWSGVVLMILMLFRKRVMLFLCFLIWPFKFLDDHFYFCRRGFVDRGSVGSPEAVRFVICVCVCVCVCFHYDQAYGLEALLALDPQSSLSPTRNTSTSIMLIQRFLVPDINAVK